MASNGREVRIEFVERAVPRLLPIAGSAVEVSCHLYHEPAPSKSQAATAKAK
jgi:hypothetical protein